jgi:hypothetical protein
VGRRLARGVWRVVLEVGRRGGVDKRRREIQLVIGGRGGRWRRETRIVLVKESGGTWESGRVRVWNKVRI